MALELTFLGTGSAYPSPTRGAAALALRREGECWLFDCGEGTQTQVMKSHLKAGRISKIFITHLHGDHFFGLPGLLCTLSLQKKLTKPPVAIYGPLGLQSFLQMSMELSHSQLLIPYTVHELIPTPEQCPPEEFKEFSYLERCKSSPEGGEGRRFHLDPVEDCYLLLEEEEVTVRAFRLFHRVPSFGFVVEEKAKAGKLKIQKLKELGVPPGPLYGKLKNGSAVILGDGITISPAEVLEDPIPGRKIAILGDCSGVVGTAAWKLCLGADLLIHEATLDDEQEEKAKEHGHSTPRMAASFAKACQVEKLVLTHFSQRYKPAARRAEGDADVTELKRQAEAVLGGQEVILAEDLMTIQIPLKKANELGSSS